MVLKYFTDGDFRFHSYILKEKVRQCKEKVQTLTESHDLHQSGVATFFMERREAQNEILTVSGQRAARFLIGKRRNRKRKREKEKHLW